MKPSLREQLAISHETIDILYQQISLLWMLNSELELQLENAIQFRKLMLTDSSKPFDPEQITALSVLETIRERMASNDPFTAEQLARFITNSLLSYRDNNVHKPYWPDV